MFFSKGSATDLVASVIIYVYNPFLAESIAVLPTQKSVFVNYVINLLKLFIY